MSFFNNLFKGNPNKNKSKEVLEREQSKFMPKTKVAIEERFIIKFIENGGKFLYSENYNELNENLGLILKENNWTKDDILIAKNKIKSTKEIYKILDEELKKYIHSIQILIN